MNNKQQLVEQMQRSEFYPHPVRDQIRLIQTNTSYVFLTGTYAYKIKKPVNLGFLNYSSLEKRRYFCDEEVRLNQRCTKGIYINVVPITCHGYRYQLEGDSKPVEYAIKMHQFPDHALLDVITHPNSSKIGCHSSLRSESRGFHGILHFVQDDNLGFCKYSVIKGLCMVLEFA